MWLPGLALKHQGSFLCTPLKLILFEDSDSLAKETMAWEKESQDFVWEGVGEGTRSALPYTVPAEVPGRANLPSTRKGNQITPPASAAPQELQTFLTLG